MKYTDAQLELIASKMLTPTQRKACDATALAWAHWLDGTGDKPMQRAHKARHAAGALPPAPLAAPLPTPDPAAAAANMAQYAELKLRSLNLEEQRDPRPSQRFQPGEFFAWAMRDAQRQGERRRLEEYLP